MGFLDFFRPRWRNSDPDTRAQAVRDLPDDDTPTLTQVAKSDPDVRVRRIAVKKLHNPAALRQIAEVEPDEGLRDTAADKAVALLVEAALAKGDEGVADDGQLSPSEALAELEDGRALVKVVQRAARDDVRKAALAKLREPKLLVEIVLKSEIPELRQAALARIGEASLLAHIARDSEHKAIALAALERVSDAGALAAIARDARIKAARQAAQARLPHGGDTHAAEEGPTRPGKLGASAPSARAAGPNPAEAKKLRQRQLQICLAIEPVTRSGHDWAEIEARLAEAQERWDEIGPVPGDKQMQERFAATKTQYRARKEQHERAEWHRAEEHKRAEEKRRREVEESAAQARAEAEASAKAGEERARREAIEAERRAARAAAAEAPAPALDVEAELGTLAGRAERMLERERIAADRLDELEARWRELDPENAAPATPAPESAPAAAPSLPSDTATEHSSAVDDGWDAPAAEAAPAAAPEPTPAAPTPAADDDASPRAALRRRFFAALGAARARAAEAAARTAAERAELLGEMQKNAERLERLVESGDAKKIDAAIKQARAGARKAGAPSSDAAELELRARLNKALDALVTRAASLKEAEGWRRWANLPKFEELIKEAEALAEVIDTVEDKRHAPAVLKELQARWKDAGSLPQEKSQQLWERFRKACDTVHEKTRTFFTALDADRPENLKKKELLCEKVEALRESSDWKATSETIKALQEEWKTIGPVPDEQREVIWKRFRGACDAFFERRGANDQARDAERAANLTRKEELVALAEGLSTSQDWRATADRIKDLQEQWKEVGPVPRNAGDELWKRFRAACDHFFDARKAAFEAQDAERTVNLEKKTALCVDAEALAEVEDQQAAIEKVKELQAQWKRIGHVPREQSDTIWNRFRAACDRVFDGPGIEELQPEDKERLGIGGFVNRLPLADVAAKLAAARGEEPGESASPEGEPSEKPVG